MTLLTHPKFEKRRREIEQDTFDEFYSSVEQYVKLTSSLIKLTDNKSAIQAFHDLGTLIHLSKSSLELSDRIEFCNLINVTIKLINIILMHFATLDDKENNIKFTHVPANR